MLKFLLTSSPLFYFVQSLWRDEAFSVLVAERSIWTLITKLSFEPPLYYILLHFWMKIFGESEISIRTLSLLGLTGATIIVIFWAEKIFHKSWLSWFLPIFFFLNPMLIYYGFEVRTYGWYIFFATLSMYAFLNQKYRLYLLAVILGFYTHTYFIFTFFVQILYFLIFNYKKLFKKFSLLKFFQDPMIRSITISCLVIFPWLVRVAELSAKLKNSWYFPVDFNLVKSVLGNMFLGYEGTPGYLWKDTALLSLVLIGIFIYALKKSPDRKFNTYFLMNIFIPLVIVIGISFIKPLFVNRYLIPVTIAEVFLTTMALKNIKNKNLQVLVGLVMLIAVITFNMWYPTKHAKFPYRDTMMQVNVLRGKNDVVYATSSLNFFETVYYSSNRKGVYFYASNMSAFPWYVGDVVFDQSELAVQLPLYPKRAIMVTPDGKISFAYEVRPPNK